jgi:hypothetical protein
MSQSEDESLEEYLEKFLYNMHKSKQSNLPLDVIHTIFLKGISDENLEALNLMGEGDISHLPFPNNSSENVPVRDNNLYLECELQG